MTYSFDKDRIYRMPTHFGPGLGPRQGPGGRTYPCIDTPKQLLVDASFEAPAAQLERFLPEGFVLARPEITVSFAELRELDWLAGRGYNTLGVSIPARFAGDQDDVTGDFLLVLWENMADPIITGREDLGFSKVYCELPDAELSKDAVHCKGLWDNFLFCELKVSGKSAAENGREAPHTDGSLHLRYMPAVGEKGVADACYPVITPAGAPNFKILEKTVYERASATFHQATFEELPTLVHVVNALADIEIGACLGASSMRTAGFKDLSDQRRLR